MGGAKGGEGRLPSVDGEGICEGLRMGSFGRVKPVLQPGVGLWASQCWLCGLGVVGQVGLWDAVGPAQCGFRISKTDMAPGLHDL